jgi:2-polyprenyl-3-methyl-5-hydroxy-6-metoxy-1,4-benzoquinol methylase
MAQDYRSQLFASYHSTHVAYLDPDDQLKIDWFQKYAKHNYLKHLNKEDKSHTEVLEIGCNKGYLLAALSSFGFSKLYGVDLSSDDVDQAKLLVPNAEIACQDAFDYLSSNQNKFDVIVLKAVLEHIQKDDIITFLVKIKQALKTGGIVLIDVPNMDWLFASHERYMDFTHEVGFTQESLTQVMSQIFSDIDVIPVDNILAYSWTVNMKKKMARFILGRLLNWADPEGGSSPIWARSIVGVGKNE